MEHFPSWTERLEAVFRMALPYGFLSLLFIVNIIALPWPLSGIVKVPFFLMAVYYWCIYRPTMTPAWLVFIVGMAIDLVSGLPLGLNALSFVAMQWVITDQRRFLLTQSFIVIWAAFAFLSLVLLCAQWGLFGLLNLSWPPVEPFFFSAFSGAFFFPLIYFILHLTHKVLPNSLEGFGRNQ